MKISSEKGRRIYKTQWFEDIREPLPGNMCSEFGAKQIVGPEENIPV
jgi:hypothetical protein